MLPFTMCMYLLCLAKEFQGLTGRLQEQKKKCLSAGQRQLLLLGHLVGRFGRPSQTPVAPKRWQHALVERFSKARATGQKRGASHHPVKSIKGGGVIRKISSSHDQPIVAWWSRDGFVKIRRPPHQFDFAAGFPERPPLWPLPRPHAVLRSSCISTSCEWRNGSGTGSAVCSGAAGFPR